MKLPCVKPKLSDNAKIALLICGPAALAFLFSACAGLWSMFKTHDWNFPEFFGGVFLLTLLFSCLAYPPVISLVNLTGLVTAAKKPASHLPGMFRARFFNIAEWMALLLGVPLSWLYGGLSDIVWNAEWSKQLYNNQTHQPLWTGAWASVFTLVFIGVCGWLVLKLVPLQKLPPFACVLCIAAIYLGASQAVLFIIQIAAFDAPVDFSPFDSLPLLLPHYTLLMLLPANCLLMVSRLLVIKIHEWNAMPEHDPRFFEGSGLIAKGNTAMANASRWPLYALLTVLPLLGVLLAALSLFGQYPDRLVRAWTETAEWTFSQKTDLAPQNAFYDEHYLCTVAAGGHPGIVKPLRYGMRHGHRIVVNRQLLIANAFEELLQEKTPSFHRALRHFYDTHGYPLSKHIRTKTAADVVYVLMKPLEWCFLLTLYLFDAKPETRIARQYSGR